MSVRTSSHQRYEPSAAAEPPLDGARARAFERLVDEVAEALDVVGMDERAARKAHDVVGCVARSARSPGWRRSRHPARRGRTRRRPSAGRANETAPPSCASASRAATSSVTSPAISETPTTAPVESNSGDMVTTTLMALPVLVPARTVSTLSIDVPPDRGEEHLLGSRSRRSSGMIAAMCDADDLRRGESVEPFGTPVPGFDDPVGRVTQDGVAGRLHDRRERTHVVVRRLAFGDVTNGGDDRVAVGVIVAPDPADVDLEPRTRAVGTVDGEHLSDDRAPGVADALGRQPQWFAAELRIDHHRRRRRRSSRRRTTPR